MNPTQVLQEIRDTIAKVIAAGLSDEQNYPALRPTGLGGSEIYISGSPNLSHSMRDHPYPEIYDNLHNAQAFNIKMIDGCLIQMAYTFERNRITSHRLAAFPEPFLMRYEDAVTAYELDELFADIVGDYSVKVPVRFDFSSNIDEHIDVDHPKSHLTLGQYSGCRIPVDGPLTPSRFMRFLLRHFYNPAYSRMNIDTLGARNRFSSSITDAERSIGHFNS